MFKRGDASPLYANMTLTDEGAKLVNDLTWKSTDETKRFADMEVPAMREFETGALRNRDEEALGYEGFLSPLALKAFGEYMHRHRFTADGQVRTPDNWQKGMPLESYMESAWRHLMDLWLHHRGYPEQARESVMDALCGLFFNVQGYMHETLKKED